MIRIGGSPPVNISFRRAVDYGDQTTDIPLQLLGLSYEQLRS
jgi:hypothetical protein